MFYLKQNIDMKINFCRIRDLKTTEITFTYDLSKFPQSFIKKKLRVRVCNNKEKNP